MEPSVKVNVPATVNVFELAIVLVTAVGKVTLKKVAVDGVIVAALVSNSTVPELWVKVPLLVQLPETVKVPPEAAGFKIPIAAMVTLPLTSDAVK